MYLQNNNFNKQLYIFIMQLVITFACFYYIHRNASATAEYLTGLYILFIPLQYVVIIFFSVILSYLFHTYFNSGFMLIVNEQLGWLLVMVRHTGLH